MTQMNTDKPKFSQPTPEVASRSDRIMYSFARHWLLFFGTVVLLYVGLPFLAPVLMHLGLTGPASVIYKIYYPVCHQLPYRSWFLFGPQVAYTRTYFEQVTGINTFSPTGLFEAKDFLGTPGMGYKVAFCQRDVAIYAGLLLGSVIFGMVRARGVRPISWLLWIAIGVVPIGLDGFSQLLSELPTLVIMPNPLWNPANPLWRESTPLLRTLTGGLFGFMLVWMSYPYIEDSMLDIRAQLQRRFGWRN